MKGTWKYERVIWEKRKSLNNNDRDQVLWAREPKHFPAKPLFSLEPLDATTWLRSFLSKVFRGKGAVAGKRPFLSPFSFRFIFVFGLSQFSGPDYLSRSLEQTKTRPEGPQKMFWSRRTAPPPLHLSQGLDDRGSPLSEGLDPPLFKVSILWRATNTQLQYFTSN